jgi:hypothetical protein
MGFKISTIDYLTSVKVANIFTFYLQSLGLMIPGSFERSREYLDRKA